MNTVAQAYFYACAALALAGALSTVMAKNPIRGAMGLLLMIISIAGLFLALHAEFLAFIQLIVYAGAIVILFIFVIMLLGPSATAPHDHRGRITRTIGGVIFGASALAALVSVHRATHLHVWMPEPMADFGSIGSIGQELFTDGIVPFELSSALLLVAVLGVLAIAKGKQPDAHNAAARLPQQPAPSPPHAHAHHAGDAAQ